MPVDTSIGQCGGIVEPWFTTRKSLKINALAIAAGAAGTGHLTP
jgi:hypothetical protein